jgi:hypothetical protein
VKLVGLCGGRRASRVEPDRPAGGIALSRVSSVTHYVTGVEKPPARLTGGCALPELRDLLDAICGLPGVRFQSAVLPGCVR